MLKYLIKRLIISFFVLFGVSISIFYLINKQPGNPYLHMINPGVPPEIVKKKLIELGYYDPFFIKYVKWLQRVIFLDLGYSIKYSEKVTKVIASRLGNTFILMGTSLFLSSISGIFLGVVSAIKKNTVIDEIITVLSFAGLSIPTFFVSLLLIKVFSYDLRLFPASGMYDSINGSEGITVFYNLFRHMILPTTVLAIMQSVIFIRYTRSAVIEQMSKEYMMTAMAKGLTFKRAVFGHALKNALLPIITVFFLQLPTIFSGALITETVFVWPGIGRLGYEAISNRDYPLIMGILTVTAIIIILSNLFADIFYMKIDKRIKLQ
ncbi:ABC transporter permease [Pseudoleptotrichia goodfellowii]|uniref:ABC transporter, permease protein n=1 Tax=Pseudoleptotrichia goodfellowii F0264 TaxID=596323 RepID=D0GM08_9FUSO|nr:ABC transporter permease [Pseudoleptotrichia goodfellowii]EEY34944.1 ABC transporter, permease protein [Pseudoleptotrichia goodfellowii F0264]